MQISKGQKHEQLLRNWAEKQVVRIQKFYHQNLLQPDPRPHLRAPVTSAVVSYMTSSAFCLTTPFLLSVYLTVLFLAGPSVWQLPLRRPRIHIYIWTAVMRISNATLHLHAHRIWEILISVSLSVWMIFESMLGIHCAQVRGYYLILPIEEQCSVGMKATEWENALY